MSGVDYFKGGDYLNTLLNLRVLYKNNGFLYFGLYMKLFLNFLVFKKEHLSKILHQGALLVFPVGKSFCNTAPAVSERWNAARC